MELGKVAWFDLRNISRNASRNLSPKNDIQSKKSLTLAFLKRFGRFIAHFKAEDILILKMPFILTYWWLNVDKKCEIDDKSLWNW